MATELKKTAGDITRSETQDTRAPGAVYRPGTDIYEKDDQVTLVVDMPGVAPESVDVSIENRSLTVRGVMEVPAPDGYRQIYNEYAPGSFERSFSLPDTIDTGNVDASHRDGVLTLVLAKSEAAKPKQIKVKAA